MLRLKKVNLVLVVIAFLLSLLTVAFFSVKMVGYLFYRDEIDDQAMTGIVDVELKPYFIDQSNSKVYLEEDDFTSGVIELNISDPDSENHFNKFGLDIIVNSNVDTYFRIAIYEQFALSYESGGKSTVIATTKDKFLPFVFNLEEFFNYRLEDGYFYYQEMVINDGSELLDNNLIEFINVSLEEFPRYESRYSLLVGFSLEAVQALKGPEKNWHLDNPPWDLNKDWYGDNND